jgi:hypothetical protein
MERSKITWVPALAFVSGDFAVSLDHLARVRAEGGDPYTCCWIGKAFPYPPTVPAFFAWVTFTSPRVASVLWTVGLAGLVSVGAWASWTSRRRLGLLDIPLPMVIAAALFSAPVLFAVERCQCDLIALPWLIAGSWLLRSGTRRSEVLAGAAFVMAAWVKYYPGLVIVALLAGRRWRAVAGFVAVGLAVGLADVQGVRGSLENIRSGFLHHSIDTPQQMVAHVHSLSLYWRALWSDTPFAALGRLPGSAGAAALLLPLAGWVALRVTRSQKGTELAYPLTLWLVSLGTFLPKVAADYNLVFLPLAILATWDRRERPAVHLGMLLAFLALQPFRFDASARFLFLCKLAGLVAVGLSLVRKAAEPAEIPGANQSAYAGPTFLRRRPAAGVDAHESTG